MSQRSACSAAANATAEVSEPPRPERGDAVIRRRCPGSRRPPATCPACMRAINSSPSIACDARLAVLAVGFDRRSASPSRSGPRRPDSAGDRHQAGRHLLAGRHHGVIFAGVKQRGQLLAPVDKLVGGARHGRDHHRDLIARDRPRAFTRAATLRIRSRSATEVPPNFITIRAIHLSLVENRPASHTA